jgi:hypothetical protein
MPAWLQSALFAWSGRDAEPIFNSRNGRRLRGKAEVVTENFLSIVDKFRLHSK